MDGENPNFMKETGSMVLGVHISQGVAKYYPPYAPQTY